VREYHMGECISDTGRVISGVGSWPGPPFVLLFFHLLFFFHFFCVNTRANQRLCGAARVVGANILLAYFHYCNKHYHPFSSDCKDQDLQSLGELDEQKIKFVHETRTWAEEKSRYLRGPVGYGHSHLGDMEANFADSIIRRRVGPSSTARGLRRQLLFRQPALRGDMGTTADHLIGQSTIGVCTSILKQKAPARPMQQNEKRKFLLLSSAGCGFEKRAGRPNGRFLVVGSIPAWDLGTTNAQLPTFEVASFGESWITDGAQLLSVTQYLKEQRSGR
jgi:hypothetical protein